MKTKARVLQIITLCLLCLNLLADSIDLKIEIVVRLDFQTEVGKIYQIVSSPGANSPVWTPEGERIIGTGERFQSTFLTTASSTKIFRVEEVNLISGLVAYYAISGNASDFTTNRNHATVIGATLTTNRFGVAQSAYQFNGTNQYLTAPHRAYLNFTNDADFTISLWALMKNPENVGVFIGKDNGTGDQPKWVFVAGGVPDQSPGQRIHFDINPPPQWIATPLYTPPANTWQHYVVRKTGPTYSFFINGNLISTSISTAPISSQITAPLTIGQAEGVGWFAGQMDDIKIYNRAILASEIKALFEITD